MPYFDISADELSKLIADKSLERLSEEYGGVEGLTRKVHSDTTAGLTSYDVTGSASVLIKEDEQSTPSLLRKITSLSSFGSKGHSTEFSPLLQKRADFYGKNVLPPPKYKSFWDFALEAMKDKTLIVLSIAAVIKIATSIYKIITTSNYIVIADGIAILLAIASAVLVSSISNYRKQAQFKALSSYSASMATATVIRDGNRQQIQITQILVGDVLVLATGDLLPADGILINGHSLLIDESSLTGESDAIKKNAERDPFILSGAKVVNGVGTYLVTCVGSHSVNGKTLLALSLETEATPLQAKLGRLADHIAIFGISSAAFMVVVLLVAYFTVIPINDRKKTLEEKLITVDIASDIIYIFIAAITLIVVAIPEGLPMAVTLALAHAMIKMLKDQNLVRHLKACETMGNATTICSDKTGTLTMNRMTVVKGRIYNKDFVHTDIKPLQDIPVEEFSRCVNVNSTASENMNQSGKTEFIGSKTEVALLEFSRKLGFEYDQHRTAAKILEVFPFSSEMKSMATVVEYEHQRILYVKGASEIVLKGCTHLNRANGEVVPISQDDRRINSELIHSFASQALRTIGIAYKVCASADDCASERLTLLGIVGIQDPVRPEVPGAVAKCQKAGIVVRVVTGDNQVTARAIAKECGILTDGLVMEGPEFRSLTDEDRKAIVPKLQVLARSSPMDKQILVRTLKCLGETVAVTGDGTNDAPALKAADVGFSMGIAGTEVAKEASDIVLLDDNFASLVKAVVWGRSVYDSVRKFLQFQLTVNLSAVIITVTSAIFSTYRSVNLTPQPIFSIIQLLWVNMIMNSFAAFALATDPPSDALLDRRPDKKSDPLISVYMKRQILGQAAYQVILCLTMAVIGADKFGLAYKPDDTTYNSRLDSTLVFNVFVFCQLFNEINSRVITRKLNVFHRFFKNEIFLGIFISTAAAQAIIVQFGGDVFKVADGGLPAFGWMVCIVSGLGSLVVGFLIRVLMPSVKEYRRKRRPGEDERADERSVLIA